MFSRPTSLMLFNRNTVSNYIPNTRGVYYLRGIADENSLYPIYFIGRAKKGEMRENLLRQCIENDWPEVVYFNYIECDTDREAKTLLKNELARHTPKYNFERQIATTFIQVPKLKFNR